MGGRSRWWRRLEADLPELDRLSRRGIDELIGEVVRMEFDGASYRKVKKHVQRRLREDEGLLVEPQRDLSDEELREYRKKWWPERHGPDGDAD